MACIEAPNMPFSTLRHKRMYFMDMGYIIGASSGFETSYLYVEYLSCGSVHGRPVTVDNLRMKGANV